ncbi:MAG TPA: ATP-binding protein [Kineosporiaceae bacterium]
MTLTDPGWEDANNRYLSASLRWVRARLEALAASAHPAARRTVPPADATAQRPSGPAPLDAVPTARATLRPPEPVAAHPRRHWWGGRINPEPPPVPTVSPSPATADSRSDATADFRSDVTADSRSDVPAPTGSLTDQETVRSAAAERVDAAAAMPGAPPALELLAQRLALTDFERDTLLLCVAPAVDPSLGAAIARAAGDPAATAPTFALAMRLFDDARWDVQSGDRGLRYWRLVEVVAGPAQPTTTAPLRADDRIVNLVKGLNHVDERLVGLVEERVDPAPGLTLPPSGTAAAERLLTALVSPGVDGRFPVVEVVAPDADTAEVLCARAFRHVHRALFRVNAPALAGLGPDVEVVGRLWQRESLLLPVALLVDACEDDLADPHLAGPLRRFLGQVDALVVLAVREVWPLRGRPVLAVDAGRPSVREQRDLWAAATGQPPDGVPADLAAQFRLSLPTLHRIAALARDRLAAVPPAGGQPRPEPEPQAEPEPDAGDADRLRDLLWAECRAASRPRLETLARRVVPRAGWSDLVLPREQLDILHRLADQVRYRTRVMSDWGFDERLARGSGITALFTGPSGTGKTFCAEVLAHELDVDLYQVDLSSVVNKYIGETEKNMRRVFDAAEDGGTLLFFDEADALFGRRSEVRDSHDRYANIEVNYLLQRMEAYHGLAVLATNLRGALDPAFLRRLRFVVEFEVPAPAERRLLWAKAFPAGVPCGDLDLDVLAELNVNGATIQQIALAAAFLAAGGGGEVDTGTVLRAARTEFRRLDLPLPSAVASASRAVLAGRP